MLLSCCEKCGILFKSRLRILLLIKNKLHKLKHKKIK